MAGLTTELADAVLVPATEQLFCLLVVGGVDEVSANGRGASDRRCDSMVSESSSLC